MELKKDVSIFLARKGIIKKFQIIKALPIVFCPIFDSKN
jgi:hypothetical protein